MKVSLLITAWREQDTIGRCISSLLQDYNKDVELLLACPDEETYSIAKREALKFINESDFHWVKDPGKGKPFALNMLREKATGDVWFFGDGDTYFDKDVVKYLVKHFNNNENLGAITGRPLSQDSRSSMMEYFGHLLTDAAHHKRMIDLKGELSGYGKRFVKTRPFFPVSGYIYASRKLDFDVPEDCLVDDAYISYVLFNKGYKIDYEPKARVFVKFPKTLSDYFKQKKRSVGGYVQLWKYGVVKKQTNTRSLKTELEYFWFPISYAKNLKEILWSLLLYPIRFWLWVMIAWERRILKKDFSKTWSRIESTK